MNMERLNWQPESLQGTDLDPLYIGCSCGLLVGRLTEQQGLSLTLLSLFGTSLPTGLRSPALVGGGAWSCCGLVYHGWVMCLCLEGPQFSGER